jgi:glycosyltransferase involved in cell wall biosynthesis
MPDTLPDSQPLHILLDGRIFEEQPLGGISRIYHEILPRICEMDENVLFSILSSGSLLQALPQHPQITSHHSRIDVHHLLRPQTLFWSMQDYLRAELLTRAVRNGKRTVWHATYFQLQTRWQGPKVTTVYDLIPEQFPQFFDKNYDDILRKRKKHAILTADKVICISESVRSDVMNLYGLPAEQVIAIPLACGDSFRMLTREEIDADFWVDKPFLLYVGRREHYKNFNRLLHSYAAWPPRKEIALLVVGSPWSAEEEGEIHAMGLEQHLIHRSGVSDEELCALYNQALAFVYPSLSEGFGIPLLEALACGCPVVASRIPAFVEVAGDAPYYFDPLHEEDLRAALDAACVSGKNPSRRDDILSAYSWDRNAQATLKIYRELAACDG